MPIHLTGTLRVLSTLLLFSLLFLLSGCKKGSEKEIGVFPMPVADSVSISADTLPRTSITFILGDDHLGHNPYYALASHYYRLHPDDRTEIVIDTIRTMLEVRDYLAGHPPANGRPYGLINLVSHGNEFIDLSTPLFPKGPRTSAESLSDALEDSLFIPLDPAVVDRNSLFYLHGCAIGNNRELLANLAKAFGSTRNGVRVKAAKYFEYYAYLSRNKNPGSIRHYFARTWYAFYHPDSIPDDKGFAQRFAERYPDEAVAWEEGVKRRFQSHPGELFHYSFVVPALWEEYYEEASQVPRVNTRNRRKAWLMNNGEFLGLIGRTGVPVDYFRFNYFKPKYSLRGDTIYALKVQGKAGVLCLIQPIADGTDSLQEGILPFRPAENDTLYFAFTPEI